MLIPSRSSTVKGETKFTAVIVATAGVTTNSISAPNVSAIPGTAISTTISAPAPMSRTMVSPPLVRETPSVGVGGSTGSTGSIGVVASLNMRASGGVASDASLMPMENA